MPPLWQVSGWITDLAGHNEMADDIMQAVASNYFSPAIMSIILWCLWFGTRDPLKREQNQRAIVAVTFGALIASLIAESFVLLQDWTGDFWSRPYDNPDLPQARQAMELLYFQLPDPSFPSNAICAFAAVATNLQYASRRSAIGLWGLLLLWAFGRMYVGIHYPVDIVGGIALGMIAAFLGRKLADAFTPQVSAAIRFARRLHLA